MLLLLLLVAAEQGSGQRPPVICVENKDLYEDLQRQGEFRTREQRLSFVQLPVAGSLEDVASVREVKRLMESRRCSAVVSDYFVSLGIATKPSVPYFLVRKLGLDAPEYLEENNLFKIEVGNYHLSYALYSLSQYYRRTTFTIVTDGAPGSSQFLVHFNDTLFSLHSVSNSTPEAEIFQLFAEHPVSLGMAWILLFSEANLPVMERTLEQAARAGVLAHSQVFFIPSLFSKRASLKRFYRSDAVFYTFQLANLTDSTGEDLLRYSVLDCMRHFALVQKEVGPGRNVTIQSLTKYRRANGTQTGVYRYTSGNLTKIRAGVQLTVLRSNSRVDGVFDFEGDWTDGRADGVQSSFTRSFTSSTDISRASIRFAAIEVEPYLYTYHDRFANVTRYSGLGYELLEELKAALGFHYKIVPVRDLDYGNRLRNGSWTGIMRMLINNEADVSLNLMTPNAERMNVSDKSVDLAEDGIQMMTRKVIHVQDFLHVFHPFSFYVWLSILLAIVGLSITLYLSDQLSPNTDQSTISKDKKMFTLFESFFLVFSSFLMSKVETEPSKLSSRLFTLLLWFSTLMYVAAYLSNLVAYLVKPEDSVTFSVLSELQETGGYRWGFMKGSAVVRTIEQDWPELYWRAQRQWPQEMYFENFNAAIERLLSDPKFVLIASADSLSYVKTSDCKLRLVSNHEKDHQLTMLFRKGFPFKEQLNQQLQIVKDQQLARLRTKYFELNRCYSGKIDIENKNQLGFEYLGGLFLFLGIGCGLAFLQLLLHKVYEGAAKIFENYRTKVKLRVGCDYWAEVCKSEPAGLWIRLQTRDHGPGTRDQGPVTKGQKEVHFLSKECLDPHAAGCPVAASSFQAGDTILVKFYGIDAASGAKIFMRSAADDGLNDTEC